MPVGVRSDSTWNNPEPEVVLVADAHGKAVGATLGNDVNLRDFEGRSALLLGKAKDNNASCSLGPLVRCSTTASPWTMFVERGQADHHRHRRLCAGRRQLDGPDQPRPRGSAGSGAERASLPDGLVLFLGTLFAPTQDRDEPGRGFTHKVGDTVVISNPRLGTLVNPVMTSADARPGPSSGDLMRNLAKRGLL